MSRSRTAVSKRPAGSMENSLDSGLVEEVITSKRPPFSKRKVAILMGYCGTKNPNAKTIERELFDSLVKDGLVSAENAVDPKKIGWMRACRTDKGVHAAGQVVSAKILVKAEQPASEDKERSALKETVIRLNQLLPSDIRIFGIQRAANSFHAKERCDSRFYEYLLPTYCLSPVDPALYLNPISRPFEEFKATEPEVGKAGIEDDSDQEAERLEGQEEINASAADEWVCRLDEVELQLIKDYRIDSTTMELLRRFMDSYKGTHSFHNFTIGKSASDFSCRRHIFEVKVGEPFMREGIEWVSLVFHGQSFMLHQIRKMVGLVIMSIRLGCAVDIVVRCFRPAKVNIPKAPSLGLLLDKGVFKGYNMKFAGTRDQIEFDDFATERTQLKDELIYPKIYGEEVAYNRFMGWLKCNDEHASEFGFFCESMKPMQSYSLDDEANKE